MSKDDDQSEVTPRLRFPEFRECGNWSPKPLADLLNYEQPTPYLVESQDYGNSGTPVLTANKSFVLGYTDEKSGIYDNVPAVIFDDFTTDAKLVDFPFKVKSSAIKILRKKRPEDELPVTFELLRRIPFDPIQHKRYYISEYQHLAIPLPPDPAEQRKIAACLGSLDDWIAAEARALAALRRHKTGLMQQLFPRPGQTRPRLRFPEFADAGDWRDQSTKQVCERIMDGTHFSPQSKEGPRPYLTSKNVRDGYLDLSTLTYISEADHQEIYARCPVQKDDVFLTKDGASTGNANSTPLRKKSLCSQAWRCSGPIARDHPGLPLLHDLVYAVPGTTLWFDLGPSNHAYHVDEACEVLSCTPQARRTTPHHRLPRLAGRPPRGAGRPPRRPPPPQARPDAAALSRAHWPLIHARLPEDLRF